MGFLDNVLSDKETPARTQSATDEKADAAAGNASASGSAATDKDEGWSDDRNGSEGAATSAAEAKGEEKAGEKAGASKDAQAGANASTEAEGKQQGRDEKGRFQKQDTVPQEALHAERQRRQALEQELQRLRQGQTQKPPSVLEDEDGAFSARIAQATAPLQEKLFRLSVKAARNVPGREDYDEVTAAFTDAVDRDPQLAKSFREADDPGDFAYTVGKQIKELADVGGDIMRYGEKKRAEGAAEVSALKDQLKALTQEIETLKASNEKRSKVPQSLNSEQSAAGRDLQFAGPRPLTSILS